MLQRLLTTGACTAGLIMLASWPLVCVALRPPETVRVVHVPAQPGVGRLTLSPSAMPRPLGCARPPVRHHAYPAQLGVTVIDVAGALAPQALPALLRLAPDERVVSVDDRAVSSDLEAGALIASSAVQAGQFVDVTVRTDGPDVNSTDSDAPAQRRVLLLRH